MVNPLIGLIVQAAALWRGIAVRDESYEAGYRAGHLQGWLDAMAKLQAGQASRVRWAKQSPSSAGAGRAGGGPDGGTRRACLRRLRPVSRCPRSVTPASPWAAVSPLPPAVPSVTACTRNHPGAACRRLSPPPPHRCHRGFRRRLRPRPSRHTRRHRPSARPAVKSGTGRTSTSRCMWPAFCWWLPPHCSSVPAFRP